MDRNRIRIYEGRSESSNRFCLRVAMTMLFILLKDTLYIFFLVSCLQNYVILIDIIEKNIELSKMFWS